MKKRLFASRAKKSFEQPLGFHFYRQKVYSELFQISQPCLIHNQLFFRLASYPQIVLA